MESQVEIRPSGRHNGYNIRYNDADCGYQHPGLCGPSCNWDNPLHDGFSDAIRDSEMEKEEESLPGNGPGEYPDPNALDDALPYGSKAPKFIPAKNLLEDTRHLARRSNSLGSTQASESQNARRPKKTKHIIYPPSKHPTAKTGEGERRPQDEQPQMTPPTTQKRRAPRTQEPSRSHNATLPQLRKQTSSAQNGTRRQRVDDELTPAQLQHLAMKERDRLQREEDEDEDDNGEQPVALGKRARNRIDKARQYGVEQIDVGTLNMMDREARKLFLTMLDHGDDATMSKAIVNAVPLLPELDPRYKLRETHGWYRDMLMSKVKGFKSDLMGAFLKHTETCREMSEASEGILHLASKQDRAEILGFFRDRFDANNFREVFVFARGFVDLELSHGFGIHYLKEVYANGCYQTLMYLNCQANGHKVFYSDMVLKEHVSEYICAIPRTAAFAGKLKIEHFELLEDQLPYNKRPKKSKLSPNIEAPEVEEYQGDI